MLGKLTRYELKKLLGGKFFLTALCLLLAVNVLLNCGIQDFLTWMEAVEKGETLGEVPEESTHFWGYMAGCRRTAELLRKRYAVFEDMTLEERTAFETAMREKYGGDVFNPFFIPTDEMMTAPGYFGEETSDFGYISDYSGLMSSNQSIQEDRERAVRAAQAFGREALEDGDNYGIRRNLNIIRLYTVPQPKVASPIRGWNVFLLETPFTMLLVFLLVLLSCAGSVSGENDKQTWLLLHTAKNGKGKTLAAKYLAGAIGAAGFTVLFQLVALGAVWFQDGLLGASCPVSALQELRLFPYVMTVWQYALLVLACRTFAAVMLSVLLTSVSALSRSSVISYAAGALLLGGCLLLVYFPPKTEWLSGPLALSSPLKYFDSYCTANLFGFPVLWVVVQAALWGVLGAGCMFLAHRVYHRKRGAV